MKNLRTFLCLATLFSACASGVWAQDDAAAEIRAVVAGYDQAMMAMDKETALSYLAPKISTEVQRCGQPAETMNKAQFREMIEIMEPHMTSYRTRRTNEQLSFLGNSSIATYRSILYEDVVAGDMQQSGRSYDLIYLNRIHGEYKIILIHSVVICE